MWIGAEVGSAAQLCILTHPLASNRGGGAAAVSRSHHVVSGMEHGRCDGWPAVAPPDAASSHQQDATEDAAASAAAAADQLMVK